MRISESNIKTITRTVTTFDNRHVKTVGTIKLPVYVGPMVNQVKFVLIDEPSVYNVIMGTPCIHAKRAVASSYHHCLRFLSRGAVFTNKGNQTVARTYFITERKLRMPPVTVNSIVKEKIATT